MENKSFADVFYAILTDWTKFVGFFVLIISLALFVGLGGSFILELWGINTHNIKELNISSSGAHVLLQSVTDQNTEYVVIVPAHGWIDSGIWLKSGDRVKFLAGGDVNVDLWGVMQKASRLHEFEDRVAKMRGLDPRSKDPTSVPEHYFAIDLSKAERDEIRLLRPWTGPDGNSEITNYQNAFAGRVAKRIIPSAPLGALIGAIAGRSEKPPDKQDAFLIGRNNKGEEFRPSKEGELWFDVNDVWDNEDSDYPEKFYEDNVGYFWVKILIVPGK